MLICKSDKGKHFQPGKWTKICSLHFEPNNFYNFWSGYRILREDAVPTLFEFPTKKTKARRELVRVGLEQEEADQSSVDQAVIIDQSIDHDQNDVSGTTETKSDSETNVMEETVKVKELSMQLDKANNEIISLKRVLNEIRMEVAELKKIRSFALRPLEV